MIEDDAIALEDTDDPVIADAGVNGIIPFVQERYDRAEDYRRNDEERWLRSYTNYRGIYGSDVQFTEAEKSRVFIKITKTKQITMKIDITFINFFIFLLVKYRFSFFHKSGHSFLRVFRSTIIFNCLTLSFQ